jgi:hypothetical protein
VTFIYAYNQYRPKRIHTFENAQEAIKYTTYSNERKLHKESTMNETRKKNTTTTTIISLFKKNLSSTQQKCEFYLSTVV